MPIELHRISRVVIHSEWITVQRNTFSIEPFTMVDEQGNATHPDIGMWMYHFFNDTGDEYYGPITEIELYKMAQVS